MTSIRELTRSCTLILSMATICMVISAQIAPATSTHGAVFSAPATVLSETID